MLTIYAYLCPACLSGNPLIEDLRTGQFLTHLRQLDYYVNHTGSRPSKPTGSYFLNPALGAYEIGARQFGQSGWAGFESGGTMVLFTVYPAPHAVVEYLGTGAHLTSTGKMVLPHVPECRHHFGIPGFVGPDPVCSGCGRTWP
jgi:hypothetical protein